MSDARRGHGWLWLLALLVLLAGPVSFQIRLGRLERENRRLGEEENHLYGRLEEASSRKAAAENELRAEQAGQPSGPRGYARISTRVEAIEREIDGLAGTEKRTRVALVESSYELDAMRARSIEVTILGHTFHLGIL